MTWLIPTRVFRWSTLLAVPWCLGCSDDGTGPELEETEPPTEELRVYRVAPQETGPGIEATTGHHLAVVEAGDRNELFLFYPGTGSRPDQYERLTRRAAELGYHAISLAYVNTLSINFQICAAHPGDLACHEKARLEILLGQESGYDPPRVDPTNSAFHRLVRLLQYLQDAHPADGWDGFLTGEEPRWDRIAVAGHSQGGGHAAMTAKLYPVTRALLFGATEPNSWTMETFVTPPGRMFGFAHSQEQSFEPIIRSWANLSLPGAMTCVDGRDPPYGESHRLWTGRTDCSGDPDHRGFFHNCPVVDEFLPLNQEGEPVFLPAWDYMLTVSPSSIPPPTPGLARVVSPPGESWMDPVFVYYYVLDGGGSTVYACPTGLGTEG